MQVAMTSKPKKTVMVLTVGSFWMFVVLIVQVVISTPSKLRTPKRMALQVSQIEM